MAYTTVNKSTDYFNTKLYTGNAGTQSITGVGFQPDLIWGKDRGGDRHFLADAVRGKNGTGYSLLCSNNNEADTSNYPPDGITAIGSDGFTLGANTSNDNGGWSYEINQNSGTYVSWNWKANGAGSANTDGDINSTVSVNTTAGFSIVKYTGNLTADQSIGHGLGVTPKMIIVKNRSISASWMVYHHSLGYNSGTIPRFLQLDNNNAQNNGGAGDFPAPPTSSVFKVGNYTTMNGSGNDIIAYCFAEKTGYSKFGSYTGNANADGPFIFTGFKPSFIIIKNSSNAHNWTMIDNKRLGYNDKNYILFPDLTNAESTTSETDILSNGFKIRASANGVNQSGNTMIYMAFAEAPLVGSNNVPCTAR